ncbi:unnamed protein product [Bemisia tabaci]|uniref:Uncharacterized protein n=1 Tax=Bemisia tabaci TaxID=7038 RepID=A0AAI8Y5T8_BEMTA|nr:unnamed protein product [Bemisia tabaci]
MEPPEKQYPNEPRYKPRRTRGTPSYFYRNVFASCFIAFGIAFTTFLELTPAPARWRQRIKEGFLDASHEELERKELIRLTAGFAELPKTKEKILENLEMDEKWATMNVYTKDTGK